MVYPDLDDHLKKEFAARRANRTSKDTGYKTSTDEINKTLLKMLNKDKKSKTDIETKTA